MRLRDAVALWALAALAASGCAAPAAVPEVTGENFFPAPPELPRVQFLRNFQGSVDFEERQPFVEYLAGAEDPSRYEVYKPFSVACTKGRLYVTDSFGLQALTVFDFESRRFYVLGKKVGAGHLRKPISVFVDDAGFKYVCDIGLQAVIVYGPDDEYVRTYGDGRSFSPIATVVVGDEVFVLDVRKDTIEAEDPDEEPWEERRDQILVLDRETGTPLRRIGGHGSGEQGFSYASFLAVDRLGNIYVSDYYNYRVVKMDREGNVLAAFGRQGRWPGDFAHMKGLDVDPQGLVYVVDAAFQLVQVFDNGGRPLFPFGGARAPKGAMNLPAGVCIDPYNVEYFQDWLGQDFEAEYLVWVTSQIGSGGKIHLYAYGKRKGGTYPSEAELVRLDDAPTEPLWRMPVTATGDAGAASGEPGADSGNGGVEDGADASSSQPKDRR